MSDEIEGFDLSPELVARGEAELRKFIRRELRRSSNRARRRVVVRIVGMTATAVAAAAGVVLGFTRLAAGPPAGVSCPDGAIGNLGDDPAAQCAALWREKRDVPLPPLVAYDRGDGRVEVLPADTPPPADWRPLAPRAPRPPEPHLVTELHESLADQIAGLFSHCHSLRQARPLVDDHLRRLRLNDWLIEAEGDDPDGRSSCAVYRLDVERRRVHLSSMRVRPVPPPPRSQLVGRLRAVFATHQPPMCLRAADAAALVRREAAAIGIVGSDPGFVVVEVVDQRPCARVVLLAPTGPPTKAVIRGPGP